jgi:hypothetical protein
MTTHILDPQAADRLSKICGLFSSAHDGERASAAAKADAMVRAAGLTWAQVINVPPPSSDWQRMALYCYERRGQLSSWDRDFVRSMLNWHGEPSEKQQDCLASIFARLCSEAAA